MGTRVKYQPIRPLVRWSSVEKRLARRNGGSKVVLAVIPNANFFVTCNKLVSVYLDEIAVLNQLTSCHCTDRLKSISIKFVNWNPNA